VKRSNERVISLRIVLATVSVAMLAVALLLADARAFRAPSLRWLSAAHLSARCHQFTRFVRHAFDAGTPASDATDSHPSASGHIDGR